MVFTILHNGYMYSTENIYLLFQVIRVEAKDEDCSPHFGDICGYEIESKGQPFTISKEGNKLFCVWAK